MHPEGPRALLVRFHFYLVECQSNAKNSDYTHTNLLSLSSYKTATPRSPEKKAPNSLPNSSARVYLKKPETNVALTVLPGPPSESLELRGRVVLHFGVLLETLRRAWCELGVNTYEATILPDPDSS